MSCKIATGNSTVDLREIKFSSQDGMDTNVLKVVMWNGTILWDSGSSKENGTSNESSTVPNSGVVQGMQVQNSDDPLFVFDTEDGYGSDD